MTRPWRHAYRDPAPPIRADARPMPGVRTDTAVEVQPAQPAAAVDGLAQPRRTELPMARADSMRESGPLVLKQIRDGLLVAADAAASFEEPAALARLLQREPARLVVVLAEPVAGMVPELARRLQPWVRQGWESVRLVGSHAADGSPPPGQELADRLRVEVVAPDGHLLAVPDGSLFVVGEVDPARQGAWWHFRPGEAPVRTGPRFPEPDWQHELTTFADPGIGDVIVEQVPAGLWVRRPGPVELTDLAFAMPVEKQSIMLLVSRPGAAPLPAARLRSVVAALPPAVRDRLVAVPYGDQPVADARLGAVLATAAGRSIRVHTGLTVQLDQRSRTVVAVDIHGALTWQPLARELAWSPGGDYPRVVRWADPVDGLFAAGLGQHPINDRWLVELIEAGLWIRPLGRPPGAALVRRLPLDAHLCTIVVGAPGYGRVNPPWRAIGRLLKLLPVDARMRLRLAVPADGGHRLAQAASRACGRELSGQPAYVLDADGNLVPHLAASPGFAPRSFAWRIFAPQETAQRAAEPVTRTSRPRPTRSIVEAMRLVSFMDQLKADRGTSDGWNRLPAHADSQLPSSVHPWTVIDADHVVRPDGVQLGTEDTLPARGADRDAAQIPATGQQSSRTADARTRPGRTPHQTIHT